VPAILKTVEAIVSEDGTVTLAEPVTGPARGVLTFLVEEPAEPSATTREAMDEPLENLPRFASVDALKADLES
jgi:hypothetical protein